MTSKITDIKERVNAKRAEEQTKHAPEEFKPLFSWQGIGRFLDTEPEPQEFIFDKCFPKNLVGAIFATGGVGKTTLALQLSACLATGTAFGPFVPVKPTKVLFIGGEDSEDIFHRRLFSSIPAMGMMGQGNLSSLKEELVRKNLEVVSLVGQDRFLTGLDESRNPRTTKVFSRLQETIKSIDGLELLIIDPKSRFDGLDENDNSHATFFISCMEKLVTDHGITVLFSHHESKAQVKDGQVQSSTGRGASALRDGARWTLSLGKMSEKEAEKFGVNAVDHIEAAISKNNYGPEWSSTKYFKRGKDGVLSPADLHSERADTIAEGLTRELANSTHQFTQGELEVKSHDTVRNKEAKAIASRIGESVSGFKRGSDIRRAIQQAKFRGLLKDEAIVSGKIKKTVLVVPDEVRTRFAFEQAENSLNEEQESENQDSPKAPKRKASESGKKNE